jgi:hypothetical protein
MKVLVAVVFVALAGVWVYQLVSGRLVGGSFKVFTTREKASMNYWASLVLEAIILLTSLWYVVNMYFEERR